MMRFLGAQRSLTGASEVQERAAQEALGLARGSIGQKGNRLISQDQERSLSFQDLLTPSQATSASSLELEGATS